MNTLDDYQYLLAEQYFLREQLAGFPASARLTRMSSESRLRSIELKLAALSNRRVPSSYSHRPSE
jgi:hypothetical protein